MPYKKMLMCVVLTLLFAPLCLATEKKKRTFVVTVEPTPSRQTTRPGLRHSKVNTLGDIEADSHEEFRSFLRSLGAGPTAEVKQVETNEYYDHFYPFPQNLFRQQTPGFVNLGEHGWRTYSGRQAPLRRGASSAAVKNCYVAGEKLSRPIVGGVTWSPEQALRDRAGKTNFAALRNRGRLILIAGLLAEFLLYCSYKKQPEQIKKAEEELREELAALPDTHSLHFFDWSIEDKALYKRVEYLLDEYDEEVPKALEATLKKYRDAHEGPSTTREVLTHGLTLAGLLATLYGGINEKRLADYTKESSTVRRSGGSPLGNTKNK